MSILIVLIPSRNPNISYKEWKLPELPYLLLDKIGGKTEKIGCSSISLLPSSKKVILVIPSKDILMIPSNIPSLKGYRLRQVLPNIVEDYLIQDPQNCHFAIGPKSSSKEENKRIIAIIDRFWFKFIINEFKISGYNKISSIPITSCLSLAISSIECKENSLNNDTSSKSIKENKISDIKKNREEFSNENSLIVISKDLNSSDKINSNMKSAYNNKFQFIDIMIINKNYAKVLCVLESNISVLLNTIPYSSIYILTEIPTVESKKNNKIEIQNISNIKTISFQDVLKYAPKSDFNLCQFEFFNKTWQFDLVKIKELRFPIIFFICSIMVIIVGLNTKWFLLKNQYNLLNQQMTEILFNSCPETNVAVNPPKQINKYLQKLRSIAGEVSDNDFLVLSSAFASSLGPISANSLSILEYNNNQLNILFKPSTIIDKNFNKRLKNNKLIGSFNKRNGKWIIRSIY